MNNQISLTAEHPTNRRYPQTNHLQILFSEILPQIVQHAHSQPFRTTLNPNNLGLPDYTSSLTQPMDLSVITRRLKNGWYQNSGQCVSDFNLMIQNCLKNNPPTDRVCKLARSLQSQFNSLLAKINSKETLPGSSKFYAPPKQLPNRPLEIINLILDLKNADITRHFLSPIDPQKFPDYQTIVSTPMDLTIMRKRAEAGKYLIMNDLLNDMRMILSNCYLYNIPGSDMYLSTTRLQSLFQKTLLKFGPFHLINHNYFKTLEIVLTEMHKKVDDMCLKAGCSTKSRPLKPVKKKQAKPVEKPRARTFDPHKIPAENKKMVNKQQKRSSEGVPRGAKVPRIDEDDPSTLFLPMNQQPKISWPGMKISSPGKPSEVRPRVPPKPKVERPKTTVMPKPSLLDTIMEMPKPTEPTAPVITPEMRKEWDRQRKIDRDNRNAYNEKYGVNLMEQYDMFVFMEEELMDHTFR